MLSPAVVVTLLTFGVFGGAWGWRRETKFVYRRSPGEPDLPPDMTRRDFDRRLRCRRKLRRLGLAALYFLVGLVLGAVFVVATPISRATQSWPPRCGKY